MRFTTGITLALLMSTTGCGGDDDDGGSANPLAPTGVMSSAPTDTTTAQSDGGLSDLNVDGMRSATVDKNTIDFSSVKWEWNDARSHLEPDSLPDARVQAGSNVWRRDSGSGLIRILSYTDLSGFAFETAGGRWPLSQRRVGLYVSEISGADVETIRAGGGTGGRVDEPTTLSCWPSAVSGGFLVGAQGAQVTITVDVACNRSADRDDLGTINAAATPTQSVPWLPLDSIRFSSETPDSRFTEVFVTVYPNDNANAQRIGQLVWDSSAPEGTLVTLLPVSVTQDAAPVSGTDSPITLICLEPSSSLPKRPGLCPDRVEVGSTVSLRAIVTPTPSGHARQKVNGRANSKIECGVGNDERTCGWRISQLQGSGTPGRFESGDSVNLTWRAPSSPGSVTIGGRYQLFEAAYSPALGELVPEGWSGNKGHAAGSNTLTFNVIEPTPPPDLRPHLSCDNGDTDSAIDKNGTSCDSIDGADVMVTLTVTRPNGTTVSSLTYYVEWDVRGGVTRSIGSSHPTSTTSRGRHLLTWSSTGLTTGDQGVVVAGVRPNGYDYAYNSNQVTIVMKEK